jgi:hypothetical protein
MGNDDVAIKVPAVTLGFWIVKVAATTLGETAGDTVSMSMQLGDCSPWSPRHIAGRGFRTRLQLRSVARDGMAASERCHDRSERERSRDPRQRTATHAHDNSPCVQGR